MAGNILDAAGRQAEHIISTAADDGYRFGYEGGLKAGVDRVVEEHGEAVTGQRETSGQDTKQMLASVEGAKEQCLKTYLEELRDCSVTVAEEVIHTSLKSNGEVIKRMTISETERPKKTTWVRIYMEKTEYEMMTQVDADIISELSRLSNSIKFIVTDKEDSGNYVVEIPEGIIDISIDM